MQLRLERFFDSATLARGMGYLRDERIIELSDLSPDGRIEAWVRGSGRQPYHLHIRLGMDSKGNVAQLAGACTCPVGTRCKHMVAALFAFQLRIARGETALPETEAPAAAQAAVPMGTPLPYQVQQWLTSLTQAATEPVSDSYPTAVRDRLVYVANWTAGELRVTVMKASVTTDGSLSERATRYDLARLKRQADTRPKFIRHGDLELLRDLEAAGVPLNGSAAQDDRWRPKFLEPTPPDLWPLMLRL